MNRISIAGLLSCFLFLQACVAGLPPYRSASDTAAMINQLPAGFRIDKMTGAYDDVTCRGEKITAGKGATFASYIKEAFDEELRAAAAHKMPVRSVTAHLTNLDLSCGVSAAAWIFRLRLQVADAKPFTVSIVHEFRGSAVGSVVRHRAEAMLVPAVQELIRDVVQSPKFRERLKN